MCARSIIAQSCAVGEDAAHHKPARSWVPRVRVQYRRSLSLFFSLSLSLSLFDRPISLSCIMQAENMQIGVCVVCVCARASPPSAEHPTALVSTATAPTIEPGVETRRAALPTRGARVVAVACSRPRTADDDARSLRLAPRVERTARSRALSTAARRPNAPTRSTMRLTHRIRVCS